MISLDTLSRCAVVLLAVIASFVALRLAESVIAPILLALVIGLVLSPLSRLLERFGLPRALRAALSLGVALAGLALILVLLEPIVQRLVDLAPRILNEARDAMAALRSSLQGLVRISEEVAGAIDPGAGAGGAAEGKGPNDMLPSMADALVLAPSLASQLLIFVGTLFFFLLSRDEIYAFAARQVGGPGGRVDAGRRLRQAERLVSRYFLTITVINVGLGIAVALAMWIVGMPSPVLWGVVAAVLNFIPYLGPLIVATALVAAGIVIFDGLWSLVPAAAFVGLNLLEGQFLTPALVGRNVRVNPLLIFLSLIFWLWLWGPLGGFIAIPVLIWVLALTYGLGDVQTISSGTPGTSSPKLAAASTS